MVTIYKSKKYFRYILEEALGRRRYRFFKWGIREFGFLWAIRKSIICMYKKTKNVKIRLEKRNEHAEIRIGTSDQNVYNQVWVNQEFHVDVKKPSLILDAGAHIGLVSQYFAIKYPNAKVVSLEPNQDNFEILKRNTKELNNVYPIKAALWYRECRLKTENPEAEEPWSFRFVEACEGEGVESVTIPGIMKKFDHEHIDILKMDIEGAEREILINSSSWISNVNYMMVELHDRYRPGCSDVMYNIIEENNLDVTSYGSRDIGETVHVV
jgi:FkbM family methyltransferase